jgi:LacI family transcriptional regulator
MALSDHPDVSELTKTRVREASRRLGYTKSTQASQAARVGVLFAAGSATQDVNSDLVHHLSAIGMRAGIRIEFAGIDLQSDDPELVRKAMEFSDALDGVLLCGPVHPSLLTKLREASLPHVMLGTAPGPICSTQPLAVTTVAFDDIGMGYAATRWLFDQGHSRVAFICETHPQGLQHDRWLRGYQLALIDQANAKPAHPQPGKAQRSVTSDESLIFVTGTPESGAGPIIDRLMAQKPEGMGFVVPDTRIAATLVSALRARGFKLPTNALLFGGADAVVRATGMDTYPRFQGRIDLMAEHGINQLLQLRKGLKKDPVEILVPFRHLTAPEKVEPLKNEK